jgi:hypothetical protein
MRHVVPTADSVGRIVNLTSVDSQAPGWLQVGRCADVGPEGRFSNLNVASPAARANMALVPAGDSGTCTFTLAEGNVIVDELGRLTATEGYGWRLAPPRRELDTRECTDEWCEGMPAGRSVVRVDLGTSAPAAAVAITVTQPAAAGFVTVGLCSELIGAPEAKTSNVNYSRSTTVTGLALTALEDGAMCVYTLEPTHIVVDVQAELVADHGIGLIPITPTRFHDSRNS